MRDVHDHLAIGEIVSNLILLERDATAGYVRVLQRLQDATARTTIGAYVGTRQGRLGDLTRMSFALRSRAPDEAAAHHYLSMGRTAVERLTTDAEILAAIAAGERETIVAYERASGHPDVDRRIGALFERCLAETRAHMAWLETMAPEKRTVPARASR